MKATTTRRIPRNEKTISKKAENDKIRGFKLSYGRKPSGYTTPVRKRIIMPPMIAFTSGDDLRIALTPI
jgi:hypothetical protein